MLEALGVSASDERIYRLLLERPHATVAELAKMAGTGTDALRRGLDRLEAVGLVTRLLGRPVRLLATRPDVAVEVLVARRQEELARAQVIARGLMAQLGAARRGGQEEHVEIVVGRAAVATRFLQLELTTTDELLVLDRPPYAQDTRQPNADELELLARGVRCRGIYAPEALELPGRVASLRQLAEAGEEARVHGAVPMKLAISDRSAALLPLRVDQTTESALVVYASTVLEALISLFEMLWKEAVPVPAAGTPAQAGAAGVAPADPELLVLLASGAKDETIARQLGISLRTVNRRVSALMRFLGARTRFQAGAHASRRGLLD
jgi:DNA-binding CsgD family transcriptional regulator/sugar-specific transcriptional regulator TrmB